MSAPVPPGGPLRLTTARWYNASKPVKDDRNDGLLGVQWDKKPSESGPLTQYAYGTDNPASIGVADDERHPGGLQVRVICAFHTGLFVIGVDREQAYATTRTARLAGRADAWSTARRGSRYHIAVDGRGVPEDQWPVQGKIGVLRDPQYPEIIYEGADIKSAGWVPLPGSRHYLGGWYEPVIQPDGTVPLVRATPELIEAVNADRADYNQADSGHGGGRGGNGDGHDGQVAAPVLGWVRQAVNAGRDPMDPAVKEEIYARWLQIAIGTDPSRPFTRADFDRHYGDRHSGAVAKAAVLTAQEREWWARWGPGALRWIEKWTDGQDYATYLAWLRRSA